MAGAPDAISSGLRALPREKQVERAAQQFEALLVEHLLRTAREAARPKDEENGFGTAGDTYVELAEQHLALAVAERGGLGLSRMIVKNLRIPR